MESDMQHELALSRRGLVRSAAGAAVLGTAAVVSARTPAQAHTSPENPSSGHRTPTAAFPARDDRPAAGETVVVHVRDARTGDLDLYVGDRHVRVRDRDLASRLIAAAR
ncbi:hypothetical protein ABIA35_006894 [Catenulispora sp. MAP12-49]|jgi:hypothetical protein|uniref:hypothetical protein n=2 Tax=unclassified Catenulispora TaxID=414885 RepID=UPI0035140958